MTIPTPVSAGSVPVLAWLELGDTGVAHLYARVHVIGRTTWTPVCAWSVKTGSPATRTSPSGQRVCLACLERVTSPAPIG